MNIFMNSGRLGRFSQCCAKLGRLCIYKREGQKMGKCSSITAKLYLLISCVVKGFLVSLWTKKKRVPAVLGISLFYAGMYLYIFHALQIGFDKGSCLVAVLKLSATPYRIKNYIKIFCLEGLLLCPTICLCFSNHCLSLVCFVFLLQVVSQLKTTNKESQIPCI